MEPGLGALCASLSIRDDEESSSIVPKGLMCKNPKDSGTYIVGRVLSKKIPKLESLSSALQFAFKDIHGLEVRKLGENKFLFRFNDESEATYVLHNGPWHHEKFTLVLAPVTDGENPYSVNLSWCDFNVKIHNMSLLSIKREYAEFIGNEIGKFLEAEIPRNGFCVDNRLRMRVSINTENPQKRMIRLKLEDGSWAIIPITYERLQNFCFNCGHLDHLQKDCTVDIGDGPPPFDPWLREQLRIKSPSNLKDEHSDNSKDSHNSKDAAPPQGNGGLGNPAGESSANSAPQQNIRRDPARSTSQGDPRNTLQGRASHLQDMDVVPEATLSSPIEVSQGSNMTMGLVDCAVGIRRKRQHSLQQ
ncbi:hypothetical protein M569_03809, partial [Genlisea aurea]